MRCLDNGRIQVRVTAKHGTLSESSKGWTKELRSISCNDKEAKYDLREWAPGDEKMGKGITFVKRRINGFKKHFRRNGAVNDFVVSYMGKNGLFIFKR